MKVRVDSFLRAEDLNGATSKNPMGADILSVKFIEAKDLPFPSDEGKHELKLGLNAEEYDWLPNKTSLRALVAAFGDESDNWEGKVIKLYSVEQNVGGKLKQIVYATA